MFAGYNNKLLQGGLFMVHRNTILGICIEDFMLCKNMYVEVLNQFDLYHDEDNLFNI